MANPACKVWTITDLIQANDLVMPRGLLGDTMLVPGNIAVMAGEAGIGKTFLTSFLADSVATGTSFCGIPTTQATVLYVSMEMCDTEFRHRAISMKLASTNGYFRPAFPPMMYLDNLEGQRALYRMVKSTGAKLVIVDSLRRVVHNEGSPEHMSDAFLALQQNISRPLGCVILFIHHSGKAADIPNDVRGPQVIQDIARDVMIVRRQKDGTRSFAFKKVTFGVEPATQSFRLAEDPNTGKVAVEFGPAYS